MFCDEPIQRVFELRLKEMPTRLVSHFQIKHKFEFHAVYGDWYLFETESFYITVGYDGVVKYKKPYSFPREKYFVEACYCDGDVDYMDLVFIGQRICYVNPQGKYIRVGFDDFLMGVYLYAEDESRWFDFGSGDSHADEIVPVGAHLLKKCTCGGEAEIYLDFLEDFFIRCRSCHASTLSDMRFFGAMNSWNGRDTPITRLTSTEEFLNEVKTEKIKQIAVSNDGFELFEDEPCCYAKSIMIEFENSIFAVGQTAISEDDTKLCFMSISSYNEEFYSRVIRPTFGEMRFIEMYNDFGKEKMLFELDDTVLDVFATGYDLDIRLAEPCEIGFRSVRRKNLFDH